MEKSFGHSSPYEKIKDPLTLSHTNSFRVESEQ